MERLIDHYRHILQQALTRIAAGTPGHGAIETILLTDTQRDQYQVLEMGWDGDRRIFTVLVHAHIKDNQIWIERDGTAEGVAPLLVAEGIPQTAIVLAFYPPWKRAYTDFAVAS